MNEQKILDDAWLETCLEERIGGCEPPDLRARILARMDSGAAATLPVRRTIRARALAAAAVVLVGLSVVVAVWLRGPDQSSQPAAPGAIRVLFVEGEPRWEYRYAKNALLRAAPELEVQVWLAGAKTAFEQEHSAGLRALSALPRGENLTQYDVVLLGAVDPQRLGMDAAQGQTWLAELSLFVASGRGLAILGGTPALFEACRFSPLRGQLPFALSERSGAAVAEPRSLALTEPGRTHPIMREVTAPWSALEPFHEVTELGAAAADAAVLLQIGGSQPAAAAIAAQRGAGRVFASGIGDLWRMRAAAGDASYERLLRNVIGWLAGR